MKMYLNMRKELYIRGKIVKWQDITIISETDDYKEIRIKESELYLYKRTKLNINANYYLKMRLEKQSNKCFNLIKPFVTLFASRYAPLRKKRANPSLRSGAGFKVKPMLDGRAIARKMKIIENYNTEADGNRK